MKLLLQYPWLFVGPGFILVSLGLYQRLGPLVDAGRVTPEERRRFAIGLACWALALTAAAAAIQIGSATRVFMCLAYFPPRSVAGILLWALNGLTCAALLYWLWFRNGADLLARTGPSLIQRNPTSNRYRLGPTRTIASAFVVLGAVGGPLQIMLSPSVLAVYGCGQ